MAATARAVCSSRVNTRRAGAISFATVPTACGSPSLGVGMAVTNAPRDLPALVTTSKAYAVPPEGNSRHAPGALSPRSASRLASTRSHASLR